MFYGFDIFFQVTGVGLELEDFLLFCKENNFLIDWYNFQRTSIEKSNWTYKTLVTKISYPIIEVFGQNYWDELNNKLKLYETRYRKTS